MRSVKSLIILIILIFLNTPSQGRILNVPEEFGTIQGGIDAAEEGDTVLVGPGRYEENLMLDQTSVTIASLLLSTGRLAYIDSTIIDGCARASVITIAMNNSSRVVGFTITNGRSASGGGIWCQGQSAPQLEDLLIIENVATAFGGGIRCQFRCTANLRRISFVLNRSDWLGGGAFFDECRPVLTECFFIRNIAEQASAIMSNQACPIISYTSFVNNIVTSGDGTHPGPAIRMRSVELYDESPVLDHITLTHSHADEVDRTGGILVEAYNRNFNVLITNSILHDNPGAEIGLFRNQDQNMFASLSIGYSDIDERNDSIYIEEGCSLERREGNIGTNPLFSDPDNGDFRLSPDSPCIDAGDPDSPLDPDGTRADMGAFYFHQRDIEISPQSVAFDTLYAGESADLFIVLSNTGGTTLRIEEISIEGNYFSVGVDSLSMEIAPFSEREVTVTFAPEDSGDFHGSLTINSDDPDEERKVVQLEGVGKWFPISVSSDPFSPFTFHLSPPYPNPFNSTTLIRFSTGPINREATRLAVFDLSGRLVADLLDSHTLTPSHSHTLTWNAEGLPEGVYLIRLEAGGGVKTMKAVLLR